MKKALLVVGLLVVLGGSAEASQFSDGIRKTWGYLFAPVNAVTQFGGEVITCLTSSTVHFIQTVISNANVGNLIP